MRIADLVADDELQTHQAAALLVEGFREHWPAAWPDLAAALTTVHAALTPGNICRAAFDIDGCVLGWIGGQPEYDGNVWELHPLVVKTDRRGCGIGRRLVSDFEVQVRQRGGLTVRLGTDDEDGMTSLAGVDLYADLPARIAGIQNLKRHPYGFYQKCGYVIVGVVPDANGRGKPDILMAKRIEGREQGEK